MCTAQLTWILTEREVPVFLERIGNVNNNHLMHIYNLFKAGN